MAGSIFYLHGFASSAKSTKGAYLSQRFWQHGLSLRCPDFNLPDFATLTLTRMLDQLDREMTEAASFAPGPATLIGSSLAAYRTESTKSGRKYVRVDGDRAVMAKLVSDEESVMLGSRRGHL